MKRLILFLLVPFALIGICWLLSRSDRSPVARPGSNSYRVKALPPPSLPPAPQALLSTSNTFESAKPLAADTHVEVAAIDAFAGWANQFLATPGQTSVARGEALAWKRREAMLELIETDPRKAYENRVPYDWRIALPTNITRHFELLVDGRGMFRVAVATDFERGKVAVHREVEVNGQSYRAFVYGRRLSQRTQRSIPVHGVAIEDKLALQPDPIRILEPAEEQARQQTSADPSDPICGVSQQPADVRQQRVAADVGDGIRYFCGVDHAQLVNDHWLAAEAANAIPGMYAADGGSDWTHGPKNVLYLRVNFPDDLTEPISEAGAYNVMNAVNAYYAEGSYDMTALTATVTPLITLPKTKAWYSTSGPGGLLADARQAARQLGFETANYHLDIVAFTSIEGYDFGGLAFVGGKGVWLQSTGVGVTAHELGHNYGLWHANFWDTLTNFSIIGPGTNYEYGNIFDTMGSGGVAQFNSVHKNILGWLPDSGVHEVTTNGTHRIYPFDAPRRVSRRFYAARTAKDFRRDYWVEFRERFAANPWLQHGVLLNWSPWEESAGGTHMLDTTPGSPSASLSRQDSAVVIGRTFTDPVAGVHITPVAKGATGTNAWIDVQINLGAFPANQPPSLKIEIDPTNAAPGTLVHFHATASDPDGDPLAYAWSFGDLSFSTNNLPWTFKSWSSPGDQVVRCVVSDMKGGVASANGLLTVGTRSGFRVSGRVLDAAGIPLEGVHINNSLTNASEYIGGYTDTHGRYLLTRVTGEITLQAIKYGYVFTNVTWENPITVTGDVATADFLATPLTQVRLSASTNVVAENGTSTHYFTLTRSGEVTNPLTVGLYLSGSAIISSDYTLNPSLSAGTNAVEIPTNSNSIVFAFQTVNDGAIEAAETVSLTVAEAEPYVIGSLGVATITILDNNAASRPAVSVASTGPTLFENGMDVPTFVLSRTGPTVNSLIVNYSISGSAAAGVDYVTPLGVAIISSGQSSVAVPVRLIDDKLLEGEETMVLNIAANAAYTISGPGAQVRVLDDDLLTVTVAPTVAALAEPSSSGRFTVKRDGDLSANLVVYYAVEGSATSGADYTALSGSLIIPAGATSADIVVAAADDPSLEGDESVVVTLTTNIAYNIGIPGSATLWLRDNEKVTVSISAPDDATSEPGDDTGAFQISRGTVVNGNLTVNLAISGNAIGGADYVPLENAVVIPNGSSAVTLEVIAFDDLHQEPVEDIRLFVLPSTNYNVGGSGRAIVSIEDDDGNNVPAAGFSFTASSAEESRSPGISVSLSATSTAPITVECAIIGGTASSNDYSFVSAPLTFEPGERAKSLPLAINNDTLVEPAETIRLALFNPIGATLDGIKLHTYTILDDDTASVSVSATTPNASETGPVAGNFRITRSGATNNDVTVNFEITGTASSPGDYASLGTSVVIPAGAAFVNLPVIPVNDGTVEYDETVHLTLLTAPGAKIVTPNGATITVSDNDAETLPIVTVSSTTQPYAVEGGGNGEFVFSRTGPTVGPLVVHFSLTGAAGNGVDYQTLSTNVTIPDGFSSAGLIVNAINDSLIEGEEPLVLALLARDTYRAIYPSSAIVMVQDNDQRVRVDASDFVGSEPGTEDKAEFTFTRFGTTNTALQVFFTLGGTAGNGIDYVALSSSFTIPAGSLSAGLVITPLDDTLVEGPETVSLTLQANPAYALDPPSSGMVTISDDEPMLQITAIPTNIVEGARPPGVFRLIRTGDPKYNFTARLAVGGTATYNVDYPAFLTNVYFSCGVTAIDLTISPTNELVIESRETVTAALLPDPAYTILAPSNALMGIIDAGTNLTPLVTITSPTADFVFLEGTNANIILEATLSDELAQDTNNPPIVNWTRESGPDAFSFSETNQLNTTVSFTNAGIYRLRLSVSDGQLEGFAEVTVVLGAVELLSTNMLYWALNEGSGMNVLDSSGVGRHGVFSGTPNWVSNGVTGTAVRLGGTNDHLRLTSGTNFLNGLDQFSISMWIKAAATNVAAGIFTANDSGTNPTLSFVTRPLASCGASSNVIEATIRTSRGTARHISASNTPTNEWQHVALTWSNGLAPAFFINGRFDQPLHHQVAVSGFLTNCPQFLPGKGPADLPASWNGWLDDVRVFPRALSLSEVGALGSLPPTNYGAIVQVGPDVTVQLINPFQLIGMASDDGNPVPPGTLSNTWTLLEGPIPVAFTNANSLSNTIQFTQTGEYLFRLIADDGQVKVFDDVLVTVIVPTTVDVFAGDAEAAELGPDTGQFTFTRNGDIEFDLTVLLEMSGIASNGVDFIALTNAVTFVAGTNQVVFDVIPFLDHPIEGDEPFTFTIVSNLAYSIGNADATVTIHDSPYGAWSVDRFTLEELTDPTLSGEAADFDLDTLVNFAEYAVNLDPKAPETTRPMQAAIEMNPADSLLHLVITYRRRLAPTDTGYEVAVSNDLSVWNTGSDYVEEIQVTDDGNNLTETVKARVKAPISNNINQFVTVFVWLQVTGPP